MESITTETLLLLIAVAGGGGLLTLPALLRAGLPPIQTLETNKLQGSFGTLSASMHFIFKGDVLDRQLWPLIFAIFLGALSGTLMVP
jgi:uncharacterized membrane protein YfcA